MDTTDTLDVVSVGGKSYLVSKCTVVEAKSMVNWILKEVQGRPKGIQRVLAGLEGLDAATREIVLKEAARHVASGNISDVDLVETFLQPRAVAYFLWVHTRKHQAVSFEELLQVINQDNLEDVLTQMNDACGFGSLQRLMAQIQL